MNKRNFLLIVSLGGFLPLHLPSSAKGRQEQGCFRPPKGELSAPFNANEIKSFVYYWFSLFDRNASTEEFLPLIASTGLEMKFPEATLRSRDDFNKWHSGILKTIRKASHEVEQLNVETFRDGTAAVDLVVLWSAETSEGEKVNFRARQLWKIVSKGQQAPLIAKYLVSQAK